MLGLCVLLFLKTFVCLVYHKITFLKKTIMKIKTLLLSILFVVTIISCTDDRKNLEEMGLDQVETRASTVNGVQLYVYPPNTVSTKYSVKVNNYDYSVYQFPDEWDQRTYCQFATYHYRPEIISFGIEDNVTTSVVIKPKSGTSINSYTIRPKVRSGATQSYTSTRASDGTITVTLKGPQNLSVEINGDCLTPVLIFANKTENPNPNDYDHYLAEGAIYNANDINVNAGETVYIAGGAIVQGNFKIVRKDNVHFKGRGIITGKNLQTGPGQLPIYLIEFYRSNGCSVEGLTLVESKQWTLPLFGCSNATIDGVKIVTNHTTSDGIDIVSSNNVTVKNCFILTKDDCIAIKSGVYYRDSTNRVYDEVRTIRIQNCTLFNGIDGNALEIGCELFSNVNDVIYENIDVIHALCPCDQDEGVLSINNQGDHTVSNITYRNIWIEDVQRYFVNIKLKAGPYSPGAGILSGTYNPLNGKVNNINYENIYVTRSHGALHSAIVNNNDFLTWVRSINQDRSNIEVIKFKNLYINNVKATSCTDYSPTNVYLDKFVLANDGYTKSRITFQ